MDYEYVIRLGSEGECSIRRDKALTEREVVESALGAVVVTEIEAHPDGDSPGRANCRRFVPVHHA
jgi:hypothetical protein